MDGEPHRRRVEGRTGDVPVHGLDGETCRSHLGGDLVGGEALHPVPELPGGAVGGDDEPIQDEANLRVGPGLVYAAIGAGRPEGGVGGGELPNALRVTGERGRRRDVEDQLTAGSQRLVYPGQQ